MLAALALLVLLADSTSTAPPKAVGGRGFKGDSDPEGMRNAADLFPEVTQFAGKSVTVRLRAKKHRLILRDELPDVVLEPGGHTLGENKPKVLPAPMLVVECSKLNRPDGAVLVLGPGGAKVKGPKTVAVFAIEPFPGPTPATRHRMVMDNGTGVFTANTADVLLLPQDYQYSFVEGLDPQSTYRVKVGGKPGLEQVVIAVDRPVGLGDGELPADAHWGRTRLVLRGGMSAELPPTSKVAFILAGVRGLHEDHLNLDERKVDVTLELVKGTVVEPAVRSGEPDRPPPNKAITFATTMATQLLSQGSAAEAIPLLRQCLQKEPKNPLCHLLLARASQQMDDRPNTLKHACFAWKYGEGDGSAQNAKELLGGDTSKCPR